MTIALPTLTTSGASYAGVFEADSLGLSDGALISTWATSSGGENLTGSGGTRPNYYAKRWPGGGGRPCVAFNTTSGQILQGATASLWKFLSDGTNFAVFTVWRDLENTSDGSSFGCGIWSTSTGASGTVGTYFQYNTGGGDTNKLYLDTARGVGGALAVDCEIDNASPIYYVHNHCVRYENGATGNDLTISDWGVLLGGSDTLAAQSSSNPDGALAIGNFVPGVLNLPANGEFAALVFVKCTGAGLNAADMNAINAYLEAKWHPCGSETFEPFMDNFGLFATSSANLVTTALTKSVSNPIYTSQLMQGGNAWVAYAPSVLQLGATDYRMWIGSVPRDDSIQGTQYCPSTDGLTFTNPNLGQVTYAAADTNLLLQGDATHWFYCQALYNDPAGATGKKFLLSIANITNASTGVGSWVYGSDDGITGWTQLASLNPNGPSHGGSANNLQEIHGIYKRNDGRYAFNYTAGASSGLNFRTIGMYTSNDTNPSGDANWTDTGNIPQFISTDKTAQFGNGLWAFVHKGVLIGFVGRLNQNDNSSTTFPNGSGWYDLWTSRDEGLTWYETAANWLPLGGSGGSGAFDCFFLYGASQVQSNATTWRVYYSGNALGNTGAFGAGSIGYGTVPYERIGGIFPGSAGTAALVQSNSSVTKTTAATSLQQSTGFGSAVTAGNTLFTCVCTSDIASGSGVVTGATDSNGNTYTIDGTYHVLNATLAAEQRTTILRCSNCLGGSSNKITVTTAGSAYITILGGAEVSGLGTTATFDGSVPASTNSSAGNAANPTISTGSFNTANPSDFVVATFVTLNTSAINSPGGGFTSIAKSATTGADFDGDFAYQVTTTPQSGLNATWTTTATVAFGWAAIAMAYEASFTPGGTGTVTLRATYQPGLQLQVNCDASTGGASVKASLLDAQGAEISGYGLADSSSITSNTTGTAITWTAHATLPAQVARIKITSTDATVYAISLVNFAAPAPFGAFQAVKRASYF